MMGSAQRIRRTQRIATLCSATVRALTGDPALHYRDGRLWRGPTEIAFAAPHVRQDVEHDDARSLRGAADAAAMRLLHSDAALHVRLRPAAGHLGRLVFDMLEQLRSESLASDRLPGLRRNLRHRFETWSLAFHDARLTDGDTHLLLFAVSQLAWMRLTGWPLPEPLEGIMEAPRAILSPILGIPMAALRDLRGDQQAYAAPAREIADRVSELASDDQTRRKDADHLADERAARIAFSLEPPPAGNDAGAADTATAGDGQRSRDCAVAYRVHTRRYDVEARADELARAAVLRELRDSLDERVADININRGRLGRHLAATLCTPREDGWSFGQETGRLDGRRLAQVVSSPADRRVFRQERIVPKADSAVTFLIDCSGSMKARIEPVAVIVDTLTRALDEAGVTTEVLGFTTGAWHGGRARQDWIAQGRPLLPGRLNEIRHIVFKDADSRWRRARTGIAALLKPDLFREGVDAEAVQWAAGRLLTRDVRRRVLMVISDGSPMDSATSQANGFDYLDNHLRTVIDRFEATRDVEILGITVGEDLAPYYPRGLALDLARPLDTGLFMEAARLIAGAWHPRTSCPAPARRSPR